MEKCNFLKILQCPDFENLWGDFWHLSQPKKLDESDGGFCFLRIIFSSHVADDPRCSDATDAKSRPEQKGKLKAKVQEKSPLFIKDFTQQ